MAKIMGSEGITTTLQVYLYGHQEQVTNLLNESLAQADLMLEGKDLKALINHIVPASCQVMMDAISDVSPMFDLQPSQRVRWWKRISTTPVRV